MKNGNSDKMLEGRAAKCFFLIFVLLLTCILRVAVIATSSYEQVRAEQSSYRIEVTRLRGTIFDCNMVPLTNADKKTVAAVSPTPRAVVGISTMLGDESKEGVFERLKSGTPTVCEVKEAIPFDGIAFAEVFEHSSSDTIAPHIIGYTDSTGHGVSGLEAAYDSLLYSGETLDAVFTVNGKGDTLGGVEPYFEGDTSVIGNGVVTTLDINIQNITERAMQGIECGAAVVASVDSGKIRAMVSMPDFDITDVSEYLEADNSPLLNRALAAFSVGSVFKPCVAAAALEKGIGSYFLNCTGSTFIIDRSFNCHKRSGHGNVDLEHALAFSCNSYFYNLAINAGAEAVYNTASALSFGSSLKLCDGISTAKGNLTEKSKLSNPASLANLSIGQGDLLLSPVSMLTLYCAIAYDGTYRIPTIAEATLSDGKRTEYTASYPTRVMSEQTASILREYLTSVITEGTGTDAKPESCTAAGKTATAQTGRYTENGTEITNSWFCGFFPAEAPEYAVIVMSEGKPQKTTASVFAEIADGITEIL